ncbi:MAG: hypothetical protein AB7N80_09065 [Bdellovibrionales bacterium]
MNKIIRFSLLALILGFVGQVQAALSPVSVAIVPPVQFPSKDFSITGARLSLIYGQHRDVYGLDLGLIGNITEQTFVGVGVSGLFNITKGQTKAIGLQAAGLTNWNVNKTDVYGIQLALGLNRNIAASSVVGLQAALVNMGEHTTIYGAQVGVYNRALRVNGIQLGLVNVTESLSGIQIGLINFHRKGLFSVSPILNIGF